MNTLSLEKLQQDKLTGTIYHCCNDAVWRDAHHGRDDEHDVRVSAPYVAEVMARCCEQLAKTSKERGEAPDITHSLRLSPLSSLLHPMLTLNGRPLL